MHGHPGPGTMYNKSCKANSFMCVEFVSKWRCCWGATLLLLCTECRGVNCHGSWGTHLLKNMEEGRRNTTWMWRAPKNTPQTSAQENLAIIINRSIPPNRRISELDGVCVARGLLPEASCRWATNLSGRQSTRRDQKEWDPIWTPKRKLCSPRHHQCPPTPVAPSFPSTVRVRVSVRLSQLGVCGLPSGAKMLVWWLSFPYVHPEQLGAWGGLDGEELRMHHVILVPRCMVPQVFRERWVNAVSKGIAGCAIWKCASDSLGTQKEATVGLGQPMGPRAHPFLHEHPVPHGTMDKASVRRAAVCIRTERALHLCLLPWSTASTPLDVAPQPLEPCLAALCMHWEPRDLVHPQARGAWP